MVWQKSFWTRLSFTVFFLFFFTFGFFRSSDLDSVFPGVSNTAYAKTYVAPEFEVKEISVGSKKLNVAIADDREKRGYGLMHRSEWGNLQGMLFIFDYERPQVFWMKNTKLKLSIAFIDKNKKLLEIQDLDPPSLSKDGKIERAFSKSPAMYVLEVPQGWFTENKIKIGTKLQF